MAKRKEKKERKYTMPAAWKEAFKAGVARAKGGKMPKEWVEAWKEGVRTMQGMLMPKEWRERWAAAVLAKGPRSALALAKPEEWARGVAKHAEQPINLAKMPAEWRERWEAGMRRRFGQPMTMSEEWKKAFKDGVAAAKGSRRVKMPAGWIEAWKEGVRDYQPLALAESLREIATPEVLKAVAAAAAGILTPPLAKKSIARVLGKPLTALQERLAEAGSAVVGFAALNALGYRREGLAFLGGALGSLLASQVTKFLPLASPTAGLGQVAPEEVRKAVEREVTKSLEEAGLGRVTAEEVEELGATGRVGEVTAEEVEELEGVGFGNTLLD